VTDTLTALDATFLELEELDAGALMSIGGTMVFEPPAEGAAPSLAALADRIMAGLARLPRYTERLSDPRTGAWSWPRWVPDERFDVHNHLRHAALPPPGSDAQLCDLTADFFSHPLDRTRPLWETMLVEGLEGGRWAITTKTHHCMVDGVGSLGALALLLDADRTGTPVERGEQAWDTTAAPLFPWVGRLVPASVGQASAAAAGVVGAGLHAARHPRQAFERSRGLAELLVRDELIGAPASSLNTPIGQTRRYAIVRSTLGELKAIGHSAGGSLNDAALAACAAGLHRLLVERGESLPARGLRAMVPINLRDEASGTLGNHVSSLFVDLPLATGDPETRLGQIVATTRALKHSRAPLAGRSLVDVEEASPPLAVRATLARTVLSRRLFNVTITNVPGPRTPLYAFGARMLELHPFVPLAADHTVGVAIFSLGDVVVFGISADCAAVPDLDVLAFGIEEGLEELRALIPEQETSLQETRL
jgi:diacylglycerol O-acyltransferase / wax synthase